MSDFNALGFHALRYKNSIGGGRRSVDSQSHAGLSGSIISTDIPGLELAIIGF